MSLLTSSTLRWPAAIVTSMAAGLWIGRVIWHQPERSGPAERPPAAASQTAPSGANSLQAIQPEMASEETLKINRMTPGEFGVFMADAWLTPGDAGAMLRRAQCIAACDTDRAMAFYLEYKRRKGLTPGDDAGELREFMTIVGKKEGRAFMDALLKLSPDGTGELDSVIHGWASVKAAESVDWMNQLPDTSPIYNKVLKGLLWGLAQNSPSTAAKVFLQLGPEDRNKDSIYCVGDGTVYYHGLRGLNALLEQIPDPGERRKILEAGGTGHGMGALPADYVKEMAAHVLPENPGVSGGYRHMAQRWVKAAPAEAMEWWKDQVTTAGRENAAVTMASQLKMAGRASEMQQWLREHPDAPARQSIEAILKQP